MKKILMLVAMLSIMLFSVGSAYAVMGVADDVPGTDTVFPFICEKGGSMNTLWAVGDVIGGTLAPPDNAWSAMADLLVYNKRSTEVYDDRIKWTPKDIINGDCQSLISGMSAFQLSSLGETVIGSKTYYIGYIVLYNDDSDDDRFVSWVYLVDLPKGFASGFNGFEAEYYVDLDNLCENGGSDCVTASSLFPRYFILNDKADTWNWWIILKGENSTPPSFPIAGTHTLSGYICNEEEDCISLGISIPDELNIIDVGTYLPALLHTGYPKAGMGLFDTATNVAAAPGTPIFSDFTTLGWSYQRAQADTVVASWDVIHPIHRQY